MEDAMGAEMWDGRYGADGAAYGEGPNAFLASVVGRFAPGGEVVCLGAGQGRNALWLAGRGHHVVAVDGSAVAVAQVRERAAAADLDVVVEQGDLAEWRPPSCDAVVAIFAHLPPSVREAAHAAAWSALRPGGVFVVEGFSTDQLRRDTGGPKNEALLYTADLLRGDFPGATFEHFEETVTQLDEGAFHQGAAAVIRLVARKP